MAAKARHKKILAPVGAGNQEKTKLANQTSNKPTTQNNYCPLPGLDSLIRKHVPLCVRWLQHNRGILIVGDTGSGKSIVRDKIIEAYPDITNPEKEVAIVNVAAIPEGLIESELFGHKRGAFTGASTDRKGILGNSYKIVVLEELGTIPPYIQAKLLVYLDTGEFKPVGSDKTEKSETKIIATTNIDPASEEGKEQYRKDFLYRFYTVEVPPFYMRREDALRLFAWYVRKHGGDPEKISVLDAWEIVGHNWPGGAREIEQKAFEWVNRQEDTTPIIDWHGRNCISSMLNSLIKTGVNVGINSFCSMFPISSPDEPINIYKVDVFFWQTFFWLTPAAMPKEEELEFFNCDLINLLLNRKVIDTNFTFVSPIPRPPYETVIKWANALQEEIKEINEADRADLDKIDKMNCLLSEGLSEAKNNPSDYFSLWLVIYLWYQMGIYHLFPKTGSIIKEWFDDAEKKIKEARKAYTKYFENSLRVVFSDRRDNNASYVEGQGVDQNTNHKATITINPEQPFKRARKEFEQEYYRYHVETKGRKGKELEKVTGEPASTISRRRKNFQI